METLQEAVKAHNNTTATLEDLDVSYRIYGSEDAAKNEDSLFLVAKGRVPYSQLPSDITYATFHHVRCDITTGRPIYHCYL